MHASQYSLLDQFYAKNSFLWVLRLEWPVRKKSPYGFDLTDFVPFFFKTCSYVDYYTRIFVKYKRWHQWISVQSYTVYNKFIRPPVTRTGKQIFLKYVKSLFKITKICCEGIHNNTFRTGKKYFKDIKFGQTAGVRGISPSSPAKKQVPNKFSIH